MFHYLLIFSFPFSIDRKEILYIFSTRCYRHYFHHFFCTGHTGFTNHIYYWIFVITLLGIEDLLEWYDDEVRHLLIIYSLHLPLSQLRKLEEMKKTILEHRADYRKRKICIPTQLTTRTRLINLNQDIAQCNRNIRKTRWTLKNWVNSISLAF